MMKKIALCIMVFALAACAGTRDDDQYYDAPMATPTVDYIEQLDVYTAPHRDSYLNQLAMNYRSFAVYNARTIGDAQMGELFAQKAVAAFSGETPFPESLENWSVQDHGLHSDLQDGCRDLINALKNDAVDNCPEVAAEAQAKFDCWLSSASVGRFNVADECRTRFQKAMAAIRSGNCSQKIVQKSKSAKTQIKEKEMVSGTAPAAVYYPETSTMRSAAVAGRTREGVVIVNNVNIPQHLINPVPVQPMVFNQNIITRDGGDSGAEVIAVPVEQPVAAQEEIPETGDQYVTRDEFINMMLAMREELRAINARFDEMPRPSGEKAVIKVQQIPLEPRQHIMEEIFEIRFDFNKYDIKPEYEPVIKKLVEAARESQNVRVSVVGHTDTVGTQDYNFSLGGKRAEAVRQRLIQYGIPASQIVAVSAGKTDLKVQTGDQVKNAENRRVRVVKETHYEKPGQVSPMKITVKRPNALPETRMYGMPNGEFIQESLEETDYYEDEPTPLK
ncbi:MAG: OmpA family protein [Rickettsiales bacterium]|jgi:outer membrane protein OmpA-like peptidoglycan-associated protein|nr:OmpA family protein [Rickettsiales bacterium]